MMFWKRKEKIDFTAKGKKFVCPPCPSKKQFETMLEILRDAEKYDNMSEYDTSITMLTNLCKYIEQYKVSCK